MWAIKSRGPGVGPQARRIRAPEDALPGEIVVATFLPGDVMTNDETAVRAKTDQEINADTHAQNLERLRAGALEAMWDRQLDNLADQVDAPAAVLAWAAARALGR